MRFMVLSVAALLGVFGYPKPLTANCIQTRSQIASFTALESEPSYSTYQNLQNQFTLDTLASNQTVNNAFSSDFSSNQNMRSTLGIGDGYNHPISHGQFSEFLRDFTGHSKSLNLQKLLGYDSERPFKQFGLDDDRFKQVIDNFDAVTIPLDPETNRPKIFNLDTDYISTDNGNGQRKPPEERPIPVDSIVAISYKTPNSRIYGSRTKIECNGVQFNSGMILTNLHCVIGERSDFKIHYGNLKSGEKIADPTSRGEVVCDASVYAPPPTKNKFPRLDFAVLKVNGNVPAPFSLAIADLDRFKDGKIGGILNDNISKKEGVAETIQVQYWLNPYDTKNGTLYEKYYVPEKECRILKLKKYEKNSTYCNLTKDENKQFIDPSGVTHICDSDGGSSGSGIFDPESGKLLALHRGAGGSYNNTTKIDNRRNCAVPAAAIAETLVEWRLLSKLGGK